MSEGNSQTIIARKASLMRTLCLITTGFFIYGTSAEARNGFIPHYVGIEGIMGGAGTAQPLDATSVIANPAGQTKLFNHFLFNFGFIYQKQSVHTKNAMIGNPYHPNQNNQIKYVPTGTIGFNYRFNDRWTLGFASTGGGGFVKYKHSVTNPDFQNPPGGDFNKQVVNSVILSAITLGYAPDACQGYGISLLIGHSTFKADLQMPDGTEVKGHLKRDRSIGMGTRIGGIWDLTNYLTLGISAATPVYGTLHHKYKQLYKKKFQIPGTARVGLTWHVTPRIHWSIDFKELFYGNSKWVKDGQGWNNQIIFLTGVLYDITDDLTLGLGYNHARVPFTNEKVLFNALSIPLDKHHYSGGFRWKIPSTKTEFFLIGYYIPKTSVTDNGKKFPGRISQGVELRNFSWGGEIGLKFNF
jgi:long-chain fatty acid transport protein